MRINIPNGNVLDIAEFQGPDSYETRLRSRRLSAEIPTDALSSECRNHGRPGNDQADRFRGVGGLSLGAGDSGDGEARDGPDSKDDA